MQDYAKIRSALLSDLGTQSASHPFISSDMSVKEVNCFQLSSSFFKKLAPLGTNLPADERALEKFKNINQRLVGFDPWGAELSEVDHTLLSYWKQNFAKVLDFDVSDDVNFDLSFIRSNFAGGPGASLGAESESFYTKFFTSDHSATHPYLVALYRAAICESTTWTSAERHRGTRFRNLIVEGNKLFFVPKTTDISRTCCTEPFYNMLLQKAIGAFIEHRLRKHFGISLSTQPDYNRELARKGSIDGSFGTIDLASASDSISWDLMQKSVPSNLLGYLRIARCERTILPDGSLEELRMISTMGNGFTFPLQTAIFASAVRAVYQLKGLASNCPKTQFGVFGDDIVVQADAYAATIRLLTLLGFEVNDNKSFSTGLFRESCGHDYYAGHFVRGVYIKSLETQSDVYSAINRLNRWSAVTGIPLPSVIRLLLEILGFKPLQVPLSESDDAGVKVPFRFTRPKVNDAYWFTYRKLKRAVRKRCLPESAEQARILGYRDFNPYGAEITVLGGYAKRGDNVLDPGPRKGLNPFAWADGPSWLMLRDHPGERRRVKVVRASIPFWDWTGPMGLQFHSVGAWEGAYAANHLMGG